MKRRVVIPKHECVSDKPSCIGDVKITTGKTYFKCPNCGEKFLIVQNLYKQEKPSTPECLYSDERGYTCSISGLELTDIKGEITCTHACYGCPYSGLVFEDIRYDQGFVPGFYVETSPIKRDAGKQKLHAPPLSYLRDLGCKGLVQKRVKSNEYREKLSLYLFGTIIVGNDIPDDVINQIEDIFDFEHDGETHQIIPIGNDLYNIGHERFWLYHKYKHVTTRQKHNAQHYNKDERATHVCCFVDKKTMKTYVIPSKNEKLYGFQFKRGILYRYIPSMKVADANVFKDNTKFIATNIVDTNRNDVTNKDEETWGYLVINDKVDEFMSLKDRTTRIFSDNDYSGIPEHEKQNLSAIEYAKKEKTILEVVEEDEIYQKYLKLISLDEFFDVNITAFETVNPEDEQERREEELRSGNDQERSSYLFGQLMVEDFDGNITEFDIPWSEDFYNDVNDLYKPIKHFIDKYCQGFCGKTEDVLYHIYCDAVDPDNKEFTRWIDNFNGGRENEEYYQYSNKDLIQACKVKHVLKLVHLSAPQNIKAIEELFMIGLQHPSCGNPLKRGKAQEVAFDFINPYKDDEDEEGNFTRYENLPQLLKDDPDINDDVKIFGPKPIDLWSKKDHQRHAKGESVHEIRTIILGVNAKEGDLITEHCMSWIKEKKYIPLPWKNISVSGSRVLPTNLKTKYIKKDEFYGSGYFSPAVHVWKGYYVREGIKVVYARLADNSDCAALIAALEINEELEARLRAGLITPEEYEEKSIKIIAIVHTWYPSVTFNKPKLMSILHKVLYYGGYVLCNEPFRKHYKTAVRYPKQIETVPVIMKAPVTVSNYEGLSKNLSNHNLFVQIKTNKNDIHNPIFTYFDRKIGRTNKLLVELSDQLVTLCRSEYSGTSNTIKLALEANKEVIEITSPRYEYRYPQEDIDEKHKGFDVKGVPFLDFKGENDPIQKGRFTPKSHKEKEEVKKEIKLSYKKIEYLNIYDLVVKTVPITMSNYRKWNKKIKLIGRDYRVRRGIPYIPMTRYNGIENLHDYIDTSRYNLAKLFD